MDKWFKYILQDIDPYHNRVRDQMRKKGGPNNFLVILWNLFHWSFMIAWQYMRLLFLDCTSFYHYLFFCRQNWQSRETGNTGHTRQREKKTKKQKNKTNTMCVGHHYLQANTNNVNKTWALLQTIGGKDEPNIVCILKSQHGTQNVKKHHRRTQVILFVLYDKWIYRT
jgi:hypothetical protein